MFNRKAPPALLDTKSLQRSATNLFMLLKALQFHTNTSMSTLIRTVELMETENSQLSRFDIAMERGDGNLFTLLVERGEGNLFTLFGGEGDGNCFTGRSECGSPEGGGCWFAGDVDIAGLGELRPGWDGDREGQTETVDGTGEIEIYQ
jgi:hypothetical protein